MILHGDSAASRPPQFFEFSYGAADIATLAMLYGQPVPPRNIDFVWLSGLGSDMTGSKAVRLADWAGQNGYGHLRFDYSGHGRSSGRFEDGTVSRWLSQSEAMISTHCSQSVILVGSSLGGWIAALMAREWGKNSEKNQRIAGLILINPAWDTTETLMWNRFDAEARQSLATHGVYYRPSDYGAPMPITRALIEDGRNHLIGDNPLALSCPVHVLIGRKDDVVPWHHSAALAERLPLADVTLEIIADGDHPLSRERDIARLLAAAAAMAARVEAG